MPTLIHHPLCPHSRFIRLILAEYGIETQLLEERVTDRNPDFLHLNPAGRTPVFVDDDGAVVPGASVIAEYLDETRGSAAGAARLLPTELMARVETRRLVEWFNCKFYDEVTNWLVTEKVYKRFALAGNGGARTWTFCGSRGRISVRICATSAI